MPETRYIEEYRDSELVNRVPYEVSDEELQREADDARLKEILGMAHSAIAIPALAEGFKLLCKRLGVTEVEETEGR
ncbi:hypothetical protein ES703_120883 [subsurface metagenome]